MKKALLFLLVFYISTLSFFGCGSGAYKKDMDFTYMMSSDIMSLDPQTSKLNSEQTVLSMIFEGLCRLDSTGNPVPGVAEKWESNSDFTRFTFHLREGAMWSNGDPLIAEDFVFGIRRALQPSTKAIGLENLSIIKNSMEINRGELDPEKLGVYAPDSHTVVFELNASFEDFPKLTANPRYMPCQQKYFEATVGHYGMDCSYVLTNGPFTFVSIYAWTPGESLRLTKTVNYVGEREVMPKDLTLLLSSDTVDSNNPVEALKKEKVDFVQLNADDLENAANSNCEVITLNDSVHGLLMNTKNPTLESASLRGIYLQSINRSEVISRMGEQYTEALGIMPKCTRWNGKSYQQPGNIMYAQQKESIANDISPIIESLELEELPSINIICLDDDYSKHLANGIIVSWNANLPNMFNLEPLNEKSYHERLSSGNYEAALYSFSANGTMPLSVFTQFSSIASPRLMDDEGYDKQLMSLDFTLSAYQSLEDELIDQYVFYPIHYTKSYYGVNPKAKEIEFLPDTGPDFISAVKRDS